MQSLDVGSLTLIAGTGLAAGLVNAIAGGGSLISFPALVAARLPAVTANITNTVALCPGYFGGAFAQRRDLVGQRSRVMMLLPTSLIGGVVGALLLLWTGARAFDILVPFPRGQRQCRRRVFVLGANRLDDHNGHGNRCAGWRCHRRRDRLSRSCKNAPLDRDCGRPRNVGRLLREAMTG